MSRNGYSLWETALVLSIIAIISSSYLEVKTFSIESRKIVQMNEKMNKIHDAIDAFVSLNGYLPCPAAYNAARSSASFGLATDCSAAAVSGVTDSGAGVDTVRTGSLPVKSLNLAPSMAIDPWNNRITYAIIKDLGVSKTGFDNYSSNSSYVIRVNDSAGNMINSSNTSSKKQEVVAYVVISHAADGRGAYNIEGVQHNACGSMVDAGNCDLDAVFVDTGYNPTSTSAFDDYVIWKNYPQLVFDKTVYKSGSGGSAGGNCEAMFDPATFLPSSLSGLALWLDANDASTMYSNTSCTTLQPSYTDIACWKDKSSGALLAANSNSGARPDWRDVNGYRAVRFNDMEWLSIPSNGGSLSLSSVEVFVVLRTLTIQNGYVFYSKTNNQFSLKLPNASSVAVWTFNTANSGSAWGGNLTKRFLWNAIGDNNVDDLNTLFRNDTKVSSTASNNSNVDFGADTLFIGCKAASTACIKAEMYEFIVYTRRLTENERTKVKAYLNNKWNL